MTTNEVLEENGSASDAATVSSKPKRTFLRRGEGVHRRVFAKQFKQAQEESGTKPSAKSSVLEWHVSKPSLRHMQEDSPCALSLGDSAPTSDTPSLAVGKVASGSPDGSRTASDSELHTTSSWYPSTIVQHGQGAPAFQPTHKWHERLEEEELELEEFQALERQILKDVQLSSDQTKPSPNGHDLSLHSEAQLQSGTSNVSIGSAENSTTSHLHGHIPRGYVLGHEQEKTHAAPSGFDDGQSYPPANVAQTSAAVSTIPTPNWLSTLGLDEDDASNASDDERLPSTSILTASISAMPSLQHPHQHSPRPSWHEQQHGAALATQEINSFRLEELGQQQAQEDGDEFDDQSTWTDIDYHCTAANHANAPPGEDLQHLDTQHELDQNVFPNEHADGTVRDNGDAESSFSARMTSPFIRGLFQQHQQSKSKGSSKVSPGVKGKPPSAAELSRLEKLESELQALQQEKAVVSKMRTELEKAAMRLEQERGAWERLKEDERLALAAQREAEQRRISRDKRVLEKQSRALLKLPNKKERSEMDALEAILQQERKDSRAKDARHKLTVERLRRQNVELQNKNSELREEVRWHESQQLARWPAGRPGSGDVKISMAHAHTQTTVTTPTSLRTAPPSLSSTTRSRSPSSLKPSTPLTRPSSAPAAKPAAKKKSVIWHDKVEFFEFENSASDPDDCSDEYIAARFDQPLTEDEDQIASPTGAGSAPRPLGHSSGYTTMHSSLAAVEDGSGGTTRPSNDHHQVPDATSREQHNGSAPGMYSADQTSAWGAGQPAPLKAWFMNTQQAQQAHAQQQQQQQQQSGAMPSSGGLSSSQAGRETANDPDSLQQGLTHGLMGRRVVNQVSVNSSRAKDSLQQQQQQQQPSGLTSFLRQSNLANTNSSGAAPSTSSTSTYTGGSAPPTRRSQVMDINSVLAGVSIPSFNNMQPNQSYPQQQAAAPSYSNNPSPSSTPADLQRTSNLGNAPLLTYHSQTPSSQNHPQHLPLHTQITQNAGHLPAHTFTLSQATIPLLTAASQPNGWAHTKTSHHAQPLHHTQNTPSSVMSLPLHTHVLPNAPPQHATTTTAPRLQFMRIPSLTGSAADPNTSSSWLPPHTSQPPYTHHDPTSYHSHPNTSMPINASNPSPSISDPHPPTQPTLNPPLQNPQHPIHRSTEQQHSTHHTPSHPSHQSSTQQPSDHTSKKAAHAHAPLSQSSHSQPHSHSHSHATHGDRAHLSTPQLKLPASSPPVAPPEFTSHDFLPPPDRSELLQEARLPDGKVERHYSSGWKAVRFSNGTRKATAPSGASVVMFNNRDIKRQRTDGRVEYLYSEVDTWHVTHSSGIEVFYFAHGQTEVHHPSQLKEIIFADGVLRRVQPDGSEEDIQESDLSAEAQLPRPAMDTILTDIWSE